MGQLSNVRLGLGARRSRAVYGIVGVQWGAWPFVRFPPIQLGCHSKDKEKLRYNLPRVPLLGPISPGPFMTVYPAPRSGVDGLCRPHHRVSSTKVIPWHQSCPCAEDRRSDEPGIRHIQLTACCRLGRSLPVLLLQALE